MSGIIISFLAFVAAIVLFAIYNTVKAKGEEPLLDLTDEEELKRLAGDELPTELPWA